MTAVFGAGNRAVGEAEAYGATSTLIWSVTVIVSLLYVRLLLRTDNDGEGGLLALVALLRRHATSARALGVVTAFGMVGAAMFLGDSVITPAISVLSAAEGLEIAEPSLARAVLPVAVTILAGVFVIQKFGSGGIARFYGPIMLTWFTTLAVTGAVSIARTPAALQILSPHWALRYFLADPLAAFLSLGAIVLAVTGAEALYADLGHFGRKAIARAWVWIVFPALTLTYIGEAAAVARAGRTPANPFFALVPTWASWPTVILATTATVIASQAVISGAYTVVHQAAGLGLLPYLEDVAHLEATLRADLRPGGEHVARLGGAVRGGRLPNLLGARIGVRGSRDVDHHGDHDVVPRAPVASSPAHHTKHRCRMPCARGGSCFCWRTCPRSSPVGGFPSGSAPPSSWSCPRGGRATVASRPPGTSSRFPSSTTCPAWRTGTAAPPRAGGLDLSHPGARCRTVGATHHDRPEPCHS
jgi:hypothetical protein